MNNIGIGGYVVEDTQNIKKTLISLCLSMKMKLLINHF